MSPEGNYAVVLFNLGGEGAGIDVELAHESRLDVARTLYEIMCLQYPGRLVMLYDKAQIYGRAIVLKAKDAFLSSTLGHLGPWPPFRTCMRLT